jgi:hypothetical protein
VIESVGYQGTLAIDYRGTDDPEKGVKNARDVLAWALGEQPEEDGEADELDLGPDIEEAGEEKTAAADEAEEEDDEELEEVDE